MRIPGLDCQCSLSRLGWSGGATHQRDTPPTRLIAYNYSYTRLAHCLDRPVSYKKYPGLIVSKLGLSCCVECFSMLPHIPHSVTSKKGS